MATEETGKQDADGQQASEAAKREHDEQIELLRKLQKRLGVKTNNATDILKAALAILEGGEDEKPMEESEIASSVRVALDLAEAPKAEVLLALKDLGDLHGQVTTLQAERDELTSGIADRDVADTLQPFIAKGVIDPKGGDAAQADYAIFSKLARANPADCVHILNSRVAALPPQGRMVPPDCPDGSQRGRVITKAVTEFKGSVELQKVTDADAFVGLALREAGLPKLNDGELAHFV